MPNATAPTPSFAELTDSQKLLVIGIAVNTLQTEVHKHEKILIEGNGEPSLQERVRNLETYINSTKYWIRFLAGAILLQTISFGAAAIIYFIRLYPLLDKLAASNP